MDHSDLASCSPRHPTPGSSRLPALLVLCVGLAGPLLLSGPGGPADARAEVEQKREVKRTFEVRGPVALENLAGRVTARLAPGGGTATTITATIHAAAKNEAAAEELLAALDLRLTEENGGLKVEARYPLDRHRTYRFPAGMDGSNTIESTYDGKKIRITTRDEDDAIALWVDFDLELARGVGLRGKQMAGSFELTGIDGPVDLESSWGDMSFSGMSGPLEAGTGAGRLSVKGQRGDVTLATGSGDIVVTDVTGSLVAEAGSGDVNVDKAAGRVEIATGSGDVEVRAAGAAVKVATGSGDARVVDVRGRDIEVGTGSGSIQVDSPALFKGPAPARASLATGSGDIILTIDDEASMLLDFDSGNGEVKSSQALSGRLERVGGRDARRYQIGAGASHVEVDTGSGDVVLRLAGG